MNIYENLRYVKGSASSQCKPGLLSVWCWDVLHAKNKTIQALEKYW